jgi:hypothetical protein
MIRLATERVLIVPTNKKIYEIVRMINALAYFIGTVLWLITDIVHRYQRVTNTLAYCIRNIEQLIAGLITEV